MKLTESPELFEQYKSSPQWRGWLFIFVFSVAILSWGMMLHMVIPDGPRLWDFGAVPQTPAASVYSTAEPPAAQEAHPPRQMEPLPGAWPLPGAKPLTNTQPSTKAP
jgi:hypothetical protein